MALFDSYEFLCLLRRSEKLDLKHFTKLKFKRIFFPLFFHASSCCVSAEWGIFHMDRYSISVTVFYLLMCCRLKVGRDDELAPWYYRLLGNRMWRGRGRGCMMTDTLILPYDCLPQREKNRVGWSSFIKYAVYWQKVHFGLEEVLINRIEFADNAWSRLNSLLLFTNVLWNNMS